MLVWVVIILLLYPTGSKAVIHVV